MAAMRADAQRRLELAVEDHLAALAAFVPEVVRRTSARRTSACSLGRTKLVSQLMRAPCSSHARGQLAHQAEQRTRAGSPWRGPRRRDGPRPDPPGPSRPRRRRRPWRRRRPAAALRMPKPTATGRSVWRFSRVTASGDIGIGGRAGAGDAGDRDVVDEARGIAQHGGQALVVGRRRGEADEMQARRLGRQAELLVLLGRQIDDDEPVDAGCLGIGQELRHAVLIDRVVVAHQHDGRRRRPRGGSRAPGPASSSSSARPRARAARRPGSPARRPWDR